MARRRFNKIRTRDFQRAARRFLDDFKEARRSGKIGNLKTGITRHIGSPKIGDSRWMDGRGCVSVHWGYEDLVKIYGLHGPENAEARIAFWKYAMDRDEWWKRVSRVYESSGLERAVNGMAGVDK